MLALDARFAVLVLFCTLSTQWMAPISGVEAAAIARQPASRRSSGNVARYYRSPEHHMQRVLPWTRHHVRGRGRGAHHKRMESNPFSEFAQAVFSGFRNKFHHKRSHKAIVIPNNHGGSYVVPHARRGGATTPQWLSNQTSTTNQTSDSAQSQDLSAEGVPGIVVIASHVYNATSDDVYKPIAYLFETEQNGEYEFNASDTNHTQLYLVDAPTNATTRELTVDSAPEDSPVNLVDTDGYCVTFDPNPGNTAQVMTGQKCIRSGAGADAADTTHMSQTFAYNRTSGVLRPMWYAGEDDGTTDTTTAQDVAAAAAATSASASSSGNLTSAAATDSAAGAQATSTALGTRDDAAPRAPQNVTLIFVPMTSKATTADVNNNNNNAAPAQAQSSASPSASSSGVVSAAAVAPSNASASGAMSAEAVVPTSASAAGVAPSNASAAPAANQSATGLSVELVDGASVPAPASSASNASAPSAASSSSAPAASVSVAAVPAAQSSSSSAPTPSANAAEVAVAGSSSSSAAPTPSANAAAVPDTQSSSAAAPTLSVNAAAVAASIASSASASSASASASASAAVASASVDPSAPSASASASPSGGSFVAAVVQRGAAPAKTPVSTAPYIWKFQADSR